MRTFTTQAFYDAPMFTVWENMQGKVICKDYAPLEWWDLFEGAGVSDAVYDKATELLGKRITDIPLLDVESDNDRHDDDPDFRDDDAALCALELGMALIKLPDKLGCKYWRLYAVGPLPLPWRMPPDVGTV
jgi:hypothetical protein